MANQEHLKRLRKGVKAWNGWREKLNKSSLPPPDLQGADLRHAQLSLADLSGVDLSEADLSDTDLTFTQLQKANLRFATLVEAKLDTTDLTDADLRGANLFGATLAVTQICGTDFSKCSFGLTILADVDLSNAKNLHQVDHLAASTIGLDTIYRSRGVIPEAFLRGAGVPNSFIASAKSLAANPVEYYSCFISYSSHDQIFAQRLRADLVAQNLRCWFAAEDLKIGDRFQERIEESIRLFDKVMIVLSEASVQSAWVEREVNAAREREDREKRTVLFPIRIDDAVMDAKQPWAADIRRSRYIGDFTKWKTHYSYVKAIDRLLRDLKATKTG